MFAKMYFDIRFCVFKMCFELSLNYNSFENRDFSFNDNQNPLTKNGELHRNLNS